MKESNKQLTGYGFALLAVALWSGNFVVARGLSGSIHPFALSFYRWLVATLVFTPFAIPYLKREFSEVKQHFKYIAITALIGVSSFNTLIYFAGRTTTAMNLSLIALTLPIFILLISRFLYKERINNRRVFGIFVVISGVIIIITKGNPETLLSLSFNTGDPLMLLAAFCFAVHSILVKNRSAKLNVITFQYTTFLLGMLFLLPFYLFIARENIEILTNQKVYGSILYVGVCASLISFTSWNKAIDRIGASTAGMIYYLMPLFAGIVAWIFLRESLELYHLVSGVLIVGGILISNHRK